MLLRAWGLGVAVEHLGSPNLRIDLFVEEGALGNRRAAAGPSWRCGGEEGTRGPAGGGVPRTHRTAPHRLWGPRGQAGGSAHLQADGAGQQDAEPQRELLEGVAEGKARLADVHGLHHARVAQLPQAQLAVEELRAQRQG